MSFRDLIPWGRSRPQTPTPYRDDLSHPFFPLQREMNRLFDDMFHVFDGRLPASGWPASLGAVWPNVEISETDKEVRVAAEIPGLEEKDIELLLKDGVLTLRGEKHSETKDSDRHFSERYYGHFERRIPLGVEIEEDKVDARFRNGVLSVVLPKSAKAQAQTRRIEIRR